jgi:hypothetical protein
MHKNFICRNRSIRTRYVCPTEDVAASRVPFVFDYVRNFALRIFAQVQVSKGHERQKKGQSRLQGTFELTKELGQRDNDELIAKHTN